MENRKEPIISDIDNIYHNKISADKRQQKQRRKPKGGNIIINIGILALLLFTVKYFVVDVSMIANRFMEPNLFMEDFVIIDKSSYGLKLPITHTPILTTGLPKRGDVIMHRVEKEGGQSFINRVIGIPGDKINYDIDKKSLWINGKIIEKKRVKDYEDDKNVYNENLFSVKHYILDTSTAKKWHKEDWLATGEKTIPEGKYFVMADDRSICCDSRHWGLIDYKDLIGKVTVIDIPLYGKEPGPHSRESKKKLFQQKPKSVAS